MRRADRAPGRGAPTARKKKSGGRKKWGKNVFFLSKVPRQQHALRRRPATIPARLAPGAGGWPRPHPVGVGGVAPPTRPAPVGECPGRARPRWGGGPAGRAAGSPARRRRPPLGHTLSARRPGGRASRQRATPRARQRGRPRGRGWAGRVGRDGRPRRRRRRPRRAKQSGTGAAARQSLRRPARRRRGRAGRAGRTRPGPGGREEEGMGWVEGEVEGGRGRGGRLPLPLTPAGCLFSPSSQPRRI
jgi:hypothetical protein